MQPSHDSKGRPQAICTGCNKTPAEIPEYVDEAAQLSLELESQTQWSPDDFVWAEEGTLNRENGHFLCTDCYIKAGMPTGPKGWVAP